MVSTLPLTRSTLGLQIKISSHCRHASSTATAHLPRIAQPSLWSNLIPKPLRRSANTSPSPAPTESRFKLWLRNPSTSLLILGMLTGSQAIQVMQLRNSIAERKQMAQRRIEQLKDVIGRIQAGEAVDLRKELGTGEPEAEKEWRDVVDQIADEAFWLLPKEKKTKSEGEEKGSPYQVREGGDAVKSSWWSFGSSGERQSQVVEEKMVEVEERPVRRAFY